MNSDGDKMNEDELMVTELNTYKFSESTKNAETLGWTEVRHVGDIVAAARFYAWRVFVGRDSVTVFSECGRTFLVERKGEES